MRCFHSQPGTAWPLANAKLLITALFCPIFHGNEHWRVSFDLCFDCCNVVQLAKAQSAY